MGLLWLNVLQVFTKGVDKDMVCLMAARASRLENQDAIDAAIVGILADPKEVCIKLTLCINDHVDLVHMRSIFTCINYVPLKEKKNSA